MMTDQQILAALERPTTAQVICTIIRATCNVAIWCMYGLILFVATKWAWQILF